MATRLDRPSSDAYNRCMTTTDDMLDEAAKYAAEKAYDKALEILEKGPESHAFLINRRICYIGLGRKDDADKAAMQLLRMPTANYPMLYGEFLSLAADRKVSTPRGMGQLSISHLQAMGDDLSRKLPLVVGAYVKDGEHAKAVEFCQTWLRTNRNAGDQDRASVLNQLAGLYKDIGEQDLSLSSYESALSLWGNSAIRSNYVMMTQYAHSKGFVDFYKRSRLFSALHVRDNLKLPTYKRVRKEGGPLRIGILSADFVNHSLAHLLLTPIILMCQSEDHIVLYHNRGESDHITKAYAAAANTWKDVHELTDRQLADTILQDEIDVLVDLSGHTAGNRLAVFGYRPAPVQVGWVSGMMTPPAIDAINYFITEESMVPASASVCNETLLPVRSSFSYKPTFTSPEVVPQLPADRVGSITFGSFNNVCKLHESVLLAWFRIMRDVPGSCLHIGLKARDTERWIRSIATSYGIEQARITPVYPLPTTHDVLRYYTEYIDLALDTWPCSGCLTTAEALWMGVPVPALQGDTFVARQTHAILTRLGLEDMSADSVDNYVSLVSNLAHDRERLRHLRASLRDTMADKLGDHQVVADSVRGALRQAYEDWYSKREGLKDLSLVAARS